MVRINDNFRICSTDTEDIVGLHEFIRCLSGLPAYVLTKRSRSPHRMHLGYERRNPFISVVEPGCSGFFAGLYTPGHRRSLQITAQIFDALPGTAGFLREVDFQAVPVLRLYIWR